MILALGGALAVLAFSAASPATPALAASALASHGAAAPPQNAISPQQLLAMSKSHTYTPAQLAGAKAYLLSHPFQGTVEYQAPGTSTAPKGMRPAISGGFYWWGIRISLTNEDVTSLFNAMVTYGTAAVAAALCAPGVWLVVVCGAIGAFAGWLVVSVVLQATNNFGGCALNIDRWWTGYYYWYCT
ncbi:MAG: hypothetical protein M3082_16550 [Candidatus Dormibacteraeota bacterium]|nr:hypothetical protein [Candidatus Dormibacteraeota bacterium]